MSRLVFIKLSGQLMSEESQRFMLRREVVVRLAQEVAEVLACQPDLLLVLGHGAGAFGRVAIQASGFDSLADQNPSGAVAAVSAATAALNAAVRAIFLEAGVPVVSLAPSASAFVKQGRLTKLAVPPFDHLLNWGAVPLIYEDLVLSDRGGVMLTVEALFQALAAHRPPERILLLEDLESVAPNEYESPWEPGLLWQPSLERCWPSHQHQWDGLIDCDERRENPADLSELLALVHACPTVPIYLVNGMQPGAVAQFLSKHAGGIELAALG